MISPLAYVDKDAKIGNDVTVHPFAYIDKNVVIGDNCTIMPYASILSGTRMGTGNTVYQGAILGATPQDFKFKGDDTELEIGNDNVIRENVIINRATYAGGKTVLGDSNFLLEGVHLAHDTHVGNHCIFGNGTKTAGNCTIDDVAIVGGSVILKHGCHIGSWSLVRDGCRVNKDVPPYIVAAHNPITYYGINAFIMNKGGFSEEAIDNIAKAYRQIYQSGTSVENAINVIKELLPMNKEIAYLIEFITKSKGIVGVTM